MEKKLITGEIQEQLRNISLAFNYLPLIHPDGIYSSYTKEAVKAFQRENNLVETGEVDFITWQKLFKEGKRAREFLKEPEQIIPIKKENLPLKEDDENEYVRALQNMLNLALCGCRDNEILTCHGLFDKETKEAVKRWQRICRKEETGICDKTTWDLLAKFYQIKFYKK